MNSAQQRTVQRRRHTVAGTLLTVLLVVAWLWAAGVLGGPGGLTDSSAPASVRPAGLVPVAARSYVVEPGDTLWSVARGLQPRGDVRPLVDQLAHHTGTGPLRAGQRIRLP